MPRIGRCARLATAALAAALVLAACDGQGEDTGTDDGATPQGQQTADEGPVIERGDDEVRGTFSMVAMAHTTEYAGADVEEGEPNPWDGSEEPGGPYRYAAIPCSENAPVNNISGDLPSFNTMLEGSRVPASTRSHPLEFEVVEGDDGEARLEGTIELTVCHPRPGVTPSPDPIPDPEKDRIRFEWSADFDEATEESIVWRGTFQIVGGTGPYEELRGEGDIVGYFLCFAPEGCAGLGEFRDVQYNLTGTYTVPASALEQQPQAPATEEGGEDDATEEPEEQEPPMDEETPAEQETPADDETPADEETPAAGDGDDGS